ncbi:hypothetical protein C8J57DRAFT_989459, partial [Mycena rebaudengoi]
AHVPYPTTRNFANFKTDYVQDIVRLTQEGSAKLPPTRATFFGTLKLHGTNATVLFKNGDKAHPQIQCRSWIIVDHKKDNLGTYALLSAAPLSSLVDQILAVRGQGSAFSEIYICGEIAGQGVQKGVAIAAIERFFAIFNIRIDGRWVDMRDYKFCSLRDHRIYNVAQYKTFAVDIDFRKDTRPVYEQMMKYTAEVYEECPFASTFLDKKTGKPISGRGEGIVWTMVRSSFMDEGAGRGYDDTFLCNFKTKGEAFHTTTSRPKPTPVAVDDSGAAGQFADYALAERRFEQGVEYLEGEQAREGAPIQGYDVKLTGAFINWVTNDAIKEERNEMERMGVPEKAAK